MVSMSQRRTPHHRRVIRANRRFTKTASASFERRLFQACKTPHPCHVDVDLTGVPGPGAQIVAMLLHARFVLHQRGGRLRITRCPDSLLAVVRASGLLDAVTARPDKPALPEPDFAA
ncbi:STAS domain-containing protein [Actinoplanes ianthinogenes]|uniref:STAS domain-containing protein n=1 Tax=Actinoplanes ianthinogenes TaxID=122358 RepID=UPI0034D40419